MTLPPTLQTLPFLLQRGPEFWNELTQRPVSCSEAADRDTLRFCMQPRPLADVRQRFADDRVRHLVGEGLLVDAEKVWELTSVHTIEIETSTRCNWRCEYCPVSLSQKPPHTMSMALFGEIIAKAQRHGIRRATFNSYN
jgi:hypothetical protein